MGIAIVAKRRTLVKCWSLLTQGGFARPRDAAIAMVFLSGLAHGAAVN